MTRTGERSGTMMSQPSQPRTHEGACERHPMKMGFQTSAQALKAVKEYAAKGTTYYYSRCPCCGLFHLLKPDEKR